MKLTFCAMLPFAATIFAFTDPKGHEYRASGPFDSESLLIHRVMGSSQCFLRSVAMSRTQRFSQPWLPSTRWEGPRLRNDQQGIARGLQLRAWVLRRSCQPGFPVWNLNHEPTKRNVQSS